MVNSRAFLFALFAAAAAALLLVVILNGVSRVIFLSTLFFLLGFAAALLWRRRSMNSSRARVFVGETSFSVDGLGSELLSTTLNEMREGLLVIDTDMRIVASNRAAQDLFSNVDKAINNRRMTEITRNPAIYDAFLDGVRGTERAGVKVETHGPERKIFDLRVVPLSAHGKITGAVGVFFDVTRLERLELIRQEFLSNVSHELRTPLTSIVALSETLEAGAVDEPDNNRRFLSIIQKNAARMHRLIDDILELSAIEAGNVKLNPEPVRLRLLVEDVANTLSAMATSRNVTIQNLVPTESEVFGDPHRLTQMLTNLMDNAIKFNRDGGSVVIRFSDSDGYRISVADTGEGIPSHHLDRLFERFYRVDRARSRELGGTGLGLAIVKHLARTHGGEVTVVSHFGEGTEFTIDLPRQEFASGAGTNDS